MIKSDSVMKHTVKFQRDPSNKYTLITPMTPLDDLEEFLQLNTFALGGLGILTFLSLRIDDPALPSHR